MSKIQTSAHSNLFHSVHSMNPPLHMHVPPSHISAENILFKLNYYLNLFAYFLHCCFLGSADASTPEKSMMVTVGSTDHAGAAQLHNAITIVAGNSGVGGGATPSESKLAGRRFSFKRSSSPVSWSTVTDPRRVLLFFATL